MTKDEFIRLGDVPQEGVDYATLWGNLRRLLIHTADDLMKEDPIHKDDIAATYESVALMMDKMVKESKRN